MFDSKKKKKTFYKFCKVVDILSFVCGCNYEKFKQFSYYFKMEWFIFVKFILFYNVFLSIKVN